MADGPAQGPHRTVFRLMLAEYQLLREIALTPVCLGDATPSVVEAAEFLASLGLAMCRDQVVHISDRGQALACAEPVSRTKYTIAFDRRDFGR